MIDPVELRDLFDRAVSLPPSDRAAFLGHACGSNGALRATVERLLAADTVHVDLFDTEPVHVSDSGQSPSIDREPTLGAGTRVGPYEITGVLGTGGMGEVYRARDPRLDRIVAIKVLPRNLTADPLARQRLEREARAIGALSHPHICAVFDIGREGDLDFLVIEYLEGETLADRLAKGKIPLEQALSWAQQIADALVAAHGAGIVHRDLKPSNVMLTASGAKLLDFGLALRPAAPAEFGDDCGVDRAEPLTRAGMILGTVQYMAPEQLEAGPVDERTDIFAFGALLYEMLTGRRAFEGRSPAATIGNILHADPPRPSSIDRSVPRALDDVAERCLAKEPANRYRSVDEVRAALASARRGSTLLSGGATVRSAVALGAALSLAILVAVGWWRWPRARPETANDPRATVQRSLSRLTFDEGLQTDPSFSPDGRFIAYASDKSGNFDIWVQPVAGGDAVQITKSPAADVQPAWSPDGSTIAFRSEREGGGVYLVPALGGPERRLADRGAWPSWSHEGSEVYFVVQSFGNGNVLLRKISVREGTARDVLPAFTASGNWDWMAPHPDGRVSFLGSRGSTDPNVGFFTVSVDGRVTRSDLEKLPEALRTPGFDTLFKRTKFRWNRDGTSLLLETRSAEGVWNVWRVQVNPATLAWTAIERLTTGPGDDVAPSFSTDGSRIVFVTQQAAQRVWQYTTASDGLMDGRPLTPDRASTVSVDVSPNGESVLFALVRSGGSIAQQWWLLRGRAVPAVLIGVDGLFARLSRDAMRIAYSKIRTNGQGVTEMALAVRPIDGVERLLTPWVAGPCCRTVCDWAPDDNAVLTCGDREMITVPIIGDHGSAAPRVMLRVPDRALWQAQYSPNGRWVAFIRIGKWIDGAHLLLTAADGQPDRPSSRIPVGHNWADKPRWSRDGRTLYFLAGNFGFVNLWATSFDPLRGVTVGEPFQLTRFDSPAFRIAPDMPSTEMDVGGDKVFLTMTSTTGNIWMLDHVDR